MFEKLVIASNNAGKLKELSSLLTPLGMKVIPQMELKVSESPEPHNTFLENALCKARHASLMSGLPALADDSGICVEALFGAPGVHSAHYAGTPKSDAANNAKLLTALQDQANRRACYYCVLVLMRHHNDPQPLVAEGTWFGVIRNAASGAGGFGYDPHFWLPQHSCSVADLDATEKNRCSHRGQALKALWTKLNKTD